MLDKTESAFFIVLVLASISAFAVPALADPGTDPEQLQPYIEKLKREKKIPEPKPEPELEAPPVPVPILEVSSEPSDNPEIVQPYIEGVRRKIGLSAPGGDQDPRPYIDELKDGKQLGPEYSKTVDEAAGFAVVAKSKFDVRTEKAQANSFESVYTPDEKYSPSLDLFYERQLYRSRYVGAIGPVFHATFIHSKGKGIFTNNGTSSADTIFKFYALAISAGASYRATQLRFVQPFAQASLVGIPFLESRNDDKPSKRGISRGVSGVGGVAFNLDWLGRKNAWDQYEAHGVLHTYLIVQADYLKSIASSIRFDYLGIYGGLLFEF